jgi:hypothetical protein
MLGGARASVNTVLGSDLHKPADIGEINDLRRICRPKPDRVPVTVHDNHAVAALARMAYCRQLRNARTEHEQRCHYLDDPFWRDEGEPDSDLRVPHWITAPPRSTSRTPYWGGVLSSSVV